MPNTGTGGLPSQSVDLNKMQIDIAVLTERVATTNEKLDTVLDIQRTAQGTYATKDELGGLRADVAGIKAGIGWAIKIVVGAVIAAVISLVLVKGGVPHP